MEESNEDEVFAKYYAAKKQFKKVKKFLTFNERIEQMGGDNGRFSRKLTADTSFETYFESAIDNWREEDQGPDLDAFVREVRVKEIKTYAQLLHRADDIFKTLCEHIVKPGSKSIPAFCAILSAMARDLREKFHKYCWKSIEILVNILDLGEKVAENMEAAYLCFSILVKAQASFLSKQLKKSFTNLLPLFASSRDYVRRFAAEAYAYVLRKASDLRSIAGFVTKQAYKTPHNYLSDGCALLFYNTFVGIAGSFHSNCDQLLRDIVHALVHAEAENEMEKENFHEFCVKILVQVIGYTIEYAKNSKYEKKLFYQNVLTKMLGESKSMREAVSIMRLLQPCIVLKNENLMNEITKKKKKKEKENKKNKGKNELKNAEKVEFICVPELKKSLDNVVKIEDFELEQHSVDFISETLLTIFNDDKNRLFSRDIALKIVEKSENYQIVIELLLKTINLESFDLYMMPALGKIATAIIKQPTQNNILTKQVISFYSILCSQRRPIRETVNRESRANFFDLSNHYAFRDWLVSNFKADKRKQIESETLIDMIVAWPWLYSQVDAVKGAEDVLEILQEAIKSSDKSVINSQLVLSCTAGLFLTNKNLLKSIAKEDLDKFLERQNCSESSLLAFEIFVTVDGVSKDVEYMNRVVDLLFPAALSSIGDVRKCAFKILSSFDLPLPQIKDDEDKVRQQNKTVFEVLYEAEDSELTNFRERLLHLRKLRCGDHKEFIPVGSSEKVEMMIVADVVSQFFVGFSPLWKGVYEVLATFANGMNIDTFWNTLHLWMNNLNENVNKTEDANKTGRLVGIDQINHSDYVNARIQLFTFFDTIPDVAERRTRVISPLLLNLHEQYMRLTSSTFLSSTVTETNEEEKDEEENEEGETEEPVEGLHLPTEKQRQETTSVLKALTSLLNVFSKFNAAKSVYLEPQLLSMYEQLLGSRHESVQRAALACIFSYRNTILANYRENLEALIDEKTMRQTLPYFKLSDDEGDAQVVDEHRAVVVPILLRLLNGKLLINNKQKGMVSRRNGIIYVIGGCRSDELTFFLTLFFEQVYKIFGKDATFEDIEAKCANESFLSSLNLKIFLNVLHGVSEMLKKIARSMTVNEQKMILHVILTCGIVCKHAKKAEINSEIVKVVRMSVCERLSEMFHAFPDRDISKEEMTVINSTVFNHYVKETPLVSVIQRPEGNIPVAPFAVVKLLASICRIPSLYEMLTITIDWKIQEQSDSSFQCDTLDLLLAPLLWAGCFELMFKTIRTGILNLSELADEPMVKISELVDCKKVEKKKKVNFGTILLSQKMRIVLEFLTNQIEKEVAEIKRPASESITLLERFSDFVSESDDVANRLATPLLLCVERKKCNEETLVNMMKSLARIAPLLKDPESYFCKFPKLFARMEGRTLRDALVLMVEGFVQSKNLDERTRNILHLLCELDVWDKTKIDEPHFERRYAAYSELTKIWNGEESTNHIILAMILNSHFHLISTTTDLSLRMTAGNNVRAMVQYAGRTMPVSEKRLFLDSYLNPTVIAFVKHDVDAVREEALNTLGVMVKGFKESQHLAELDEFSNDDEELDFLKNMNHIQLYRRQRAIRKLVDSVANGEKSISFNAMNKYLVPIIHPYLVNYSAKYNAISDESLGLLKLVMSKAPWGKYCSYLEHWLSRVEKATATKDNEFTDKALVRIVVAVIEAFHFDVSLEEGETYEIEETMEDREEVVKSEKQTILQRISKVILPRLSKSLDSQAQAVEKNARNAETHATALHLDIQRAPIALAIVKLLQKLPDAVTGRHLHGVVLKLCNLMMTRSYDVRETARKTLVQIVKCLGPKYLASVITEISLTMVKGFQVHVAIFSVHTLIVAMKDVTKGGELDSAIDVIVKMCIRDQFAAEDKDNGAVKAECPEAKGNRAPEMMLHLGRIVSPAGIQMVLAPFRDVINEHPSVKAVQKVSELLSKFAGGLKDNEVLDHSQLLTYIYKSLTSDVQKLLDVETKNGQKDAKDNSRRPESCLIIPTAPQRIGAMAKVVIRSRDHVFAEFFVLLFSSLLKEKKFDLSDATMVSRLNPFVKLILDCFDFKYEKLISCSMRALCSMIKMQLPAIAANSQRVSDTLFVLMSDYSSIGQTGNKPAIVLLNQLIYKGFTNLIITTGSEFLDNDKLTLLLAYAEADVMDHQKQATMFSLIKALVKRGVRHERLGEIMDHLSETAIRSSLVNIREQCRETLLDYIGGASDTEKNVEKHIIFFLDQLDYEYETGRQSAALMLESLFKNLVAKSLGHIHMLCVVKMGAAMMNEESTKVSHHIGLALRHLLETVGNSQRQEIFDVICQWLKAEDENARAVGIQTAVQLSYVEKEAMVTKVEIIINNVKEILFDDEVFENNSETTITTIVNGTNRIISNIGNAVLTKFDAITFIKSLEELCKCEESVEVMLAVSTLIGQLLSYLEATGIPNDLSKDVCFWMTRHLRHEKMSDSIGEQASKNIVCLSKNLELEEYRTLIGFIAAACRYEVKHHVKQTLKRTSCFKLIAALFVTGDSERNTVVLDTFMPILVRELKTSRDEELSKLTQEVCSLIKKKIGDDEYSNRVATCQKNASEKITDRKRKIRELAVTAPEDAAELKRKKNKKKTEVRKRKLDEIKPYRAMKRRAAEQRKAQENDED